MILAVCFMVFLFVPLAIYVIDSGIVERDNIRLGETLQTAAEDGASSIDVSAYRQRGAVQLDPAEARQVADQSLRASQLPGLQNTTVNVAGNTVTVSAGLEVRLLFVGSITLTDTKSASFAYGT